MFAAASNQISYITRFWFYHLDCLIKETWLYKTQCSSSNAYKLVYY